MRYRPELDGIRGLAVLLVLAAHTAGPIFWHAGSVGVTLFFVLSGYLITSLLVAERASTGHVSLRAFYERRIRRLLPALLALLVFAGALSLVTGLWAGGGDLLPYPFAMLATFGYAANIVLAGGHDLGYLQHTWSLALEEQFYLAWPLLCSSRLAAGGF